MSLKLNSMFALLLGGWAGAGCNANELIVSTPKCPQYITVDNNFPVVDDSWQVSLASRYLDFPDKYKLKNGVYQTASIAPQVSYIHSERSQKVRQLLPMEEVISEVEEKYSWFLDEQKDWVFLCDIDNKVFIYKAIPKKVKKCSLIISLQGGDRSWDNQVLKCNK